MPSARDNHREKSKRAFLEAFAETCNVRESAKIAKIDRAQVYRWRKEDPDFAAAWDEAFEQGGDALVDEAKRRAHDGVDEPVFQQGKKVGTIRKYSDTLLIFLIKARKPEYRDRTILAGDKENPVHVKLERDAIIRKLLGDRAPAPAAGDSNATRPTE